MPTSHDAVGENHDVDVWRQLTESKKHAGDEAADHADGTTSEPVH